MIKEIKENKSHSELVESLATTIRKNIVAPAANRVEILKLELKETERKVAAAEKEIARLSASCDKAKLLSITSLLLAACTTFITVLALTVLRKG